MTDDQTQSGFDSDPATDEAETRMRKALGLTSNRLREDQPNRTGAFGMSAPNRGGADALKRRFVRHGDVQVTMVSGTSPKETAQSRRIQSPGPAHVDSQAANAELRAERAAREKAERMTKDAQEAVQNLRRKLGQFALARDEAVEEARRAEASQAALMHELGTVRAQLSVEASARARAERVGLMVDAPKPAEPAPVSAQLEVQPTAKRGRGRPSKVATSAPTQHMAVKRKPGRPRVEKEPEPVKWWVPKRKSRAIKARLQV